MHYVDDMLYIAQMEEGEKLYHYTTIDALINIVSGKELWITKWDYLNDIDELKVALEICLEVLKEENIKAEIIREVEKRVNESINGTDFSENYFVCSFSCDKDSQLLWSNYSNYDGVNIEIDFAKFKERLNHRFLWHGLVNYDFESQKECIKRTLHDSFLDGGMIADYKSLNDINELQGEDYEICVTHIEMICVLYGMFFKRTGFKGENEYRFVFAINKEQEITFRNKKSIVIPYIKKRLEEIDFIAKITIGPTNKIDIAAKGIRELLHYYHRDVNVVKSEIPLRF